MFLSLTGELISPGSVLHMPHRALKQAANTMGSALFDPSPSFFIWVSYKKFKNELDGKEIKTEETHRFPKKQWVYGIVL